MEGGRAAPPFFLGAGRASPPSAAPSGRGAIGGFLRFRKIRWNRWCPPFRCDSSNHLAEEGARQRRKLFRKKVVKTVPVPCSAGVFCLISIKNMGKQGD